MRVLLLLAVVGAIGACKSEPDFDERFDTVKQQVEDTATSIDEELTDNTDGAAIEPSTDE